MKGYLTMGFLMLVQSCITLTKTMRDMHEGGKLVNRIEDAKAERLLMEVERGHGRREALPADGERIRVALRDVGVPAEPGP